VLAADALAQTSPDPNVLQGEIWTPRASTGTLHLHGGLFAPVNAKATGTNLGARLGLSLGSHMTLGLLADWNFKQKSLLDTTSSSLPGYQPKVLLAKVDAHLIPTMLFLQVKLTNKFPIVPYAGVGAGYEWLILRSNDYRTDETRVTTFANWGWQTYAGMGLRLSDKLRFDGEMFYNGGSLERDITDQNGTAWREVVDAEGVGARIGLDIVY